MSADIKTQGIAPSIAGDLTAALIAQVNRFQAKYGAPGFPLMTGAVPIEVAVLALGLMQARLSAAIIRLPDPGTAQELAQIAAAASNPVAYVQPRLVEIIRTLALYGDSLGLPPAKVGVTSIYGMRLWDRWQWAFALGLAGLGGFASYRYGRRYFPRR